MGSEWLGSNTIHVKPKMCLELLVGLLLTTSNSIVEDKLVVTN